MAARRKPPGIEIELLSEGIGADAAHEISFGGRQRTSRTTSPGTSAALEAELVGGITADRPWWHQGRSIALCTLVIGLLSATMVTRLSAVDPAVVAGDHRRPAPSTEPNEDLPVVEPPPIDPNTADETPPETEVPPVATTFPLGTSLSGGAPIVVNDARWGVYLAVANRVYRLDLATGTFDLVEEVIGAPLAIVPTSDVPVVLTAEEVGGAFIAGPPGSYWTMAAAGELELRDVVSGAVIRAATTPWANPFPIGSDGTGDVIVYGIDSRLWVVRGDGSLERFPAGNPITIQPGGAVWARCDDVGTCRVEAESSVGTWEPSSSTFWLSSFSPDGTWLMYQDDSPTSATSTATLLDLRDGSETSLDLTLYNLTDYYAGSAVAGVWTPDSRYFISSSLDGIVVYDTEAGQLATFDVPDTRGNVIPLAIF